MKSIKLARSLMLLKGLSPRDVAHNTGLPSENLVAWLNGSNNTLSPSSYVTLFTYLGVDKTGISGEHVHVWKIKNKMGRFSSQVMQAFKDVAPLLDKGEMMEIVRQEKIKSFFDKTRLFILKGAGFRILLHLESSFFAPQSVEPSMIPGVSWCSTVDNNRALAKLDRLYWNAALSGSLTTSEFDDIFMQTFDKCSWGDLRLISRERGVTPSTIAMWILSGEINQAAAQRGMEPITSVEAFLRLDLGADYALPSGMYGASDKMEDRGMLSKHTSQQPKRSYTRRSGNDKEVVSAILPSNVEQHPAMRSNANG
jgi:hypothetical protein